MATRTMRAALTGLLLCLFVTSCGFIEQAMRRSMDIDFNDQRLNDGLSRLVQQQIPGRLSDYTSWDWDEVHLFNEWSDRKFIEDTVGAPVISSNIYDSKASLLVFELDGEPVKAAGVSGDYLRGEHHRATFPADAMLDPQGGGYLMLTLPKQPSA